MVKEFLKENGYRLYISIDMGILIMGIFMTFIGIYRPICGSELNDVRTIIGAVCLAIWFVMFPAINREKKDKILLSVGMHSIISVAILVLFLFEIKYFLGNMNMGKWFYDIMFCFGGVLVLTYFLYILAGFIKTFFYLIEKVKRFVFPRLKEASGVINVIEAITAGILSVTAFGASIVGVVTLLKQFMDILQ